MSHTFSQLADILDLLFTEAKGLQCHGATNACNLACPKGQNLHSCVQANHCMAVHMLSLLKGFDLLVLLQTMV